MMVVGRRLLTKLHVGGGHHKHSLLRTIASDSEEDFLSQARGGLDSKKSHHHHHHQQHTLLEKPNQDLVNELIKSPQLSVKSLPLLSSCLPPSSLRTEDHLWIKDNLSSIKEALHYPPSITSLASTDKENPLFHLETLLYLAFQHVGTKRSKEAKYIRVGHSRLWFLGQYVVELALVEYFLLRYPKDVTACVRERIFSLTSRRVLPHWIESSGLGEIVFAGGDVKEVDLRTRLRIVRDVFWALLGVSFLSVGMQEVYRVLFEVFSLDPDAQDCQPSPRLRYEDEDNVFPEFEERPMDWRDVTSCRTAGNSLFAKPMLLRACVPPGMRRFRENLWEIDSLPTVLQVLGYPLQFVDEDVSIATARNRELELGLQLCFCDPLAYKLEHPRFCNERLEYLGQKIQDLVMAETLVSKHLDAPGIWLQDKHRRLLFNRVCGKYLREYKLHNHIIYADASQDEVYRSKNSQKLASISVSQALHGLGYVVYGKAEVRRLMNEVFKFERPKAMRKG